MVVYKTTNLLNGMIYVGKDKHNNKDYMGSGLRLINAINKYGKENFKKEILEHCISLEHLAEREVYWIEQTKALDPLVGYNIAHRGCGGNTRKGYSEEEMLEYKAKLSESIKTSKKYRKAVNQRTGLPRPEHSKRMKELYNSQRLVPHNKGVPCPQHVKDILSKRFKGGTLTEEHKAKIGMSKWVEVEMYDLEGNLLHVYDSIKEACLSNNLSRDQISGCLTGRYKRGGGYVWKYKTDNRQQ